MNTGTSLEPEKNDAIGEWSETYVDIESDIPRSKMRFLEWWYSWTSPPIPPASAGLEMRETTRRGRLSSTILLVLVGIIFFLAIPVAIAQRLVALVIILAITLMIVSISLYLNRKGNISSAAWLLVATVDVGLWLSIITSPGPAGLNANSIPLYDIMILSELLAVSLLPPRSVFIVAVCNSAFVALSLTFCKHAPSLDALLALAGPEVYARPIALHFIVAFVTYLWVRSATQAIARADRAEIIAALEHQMAKQEHTIALQKRQLDHSINQIIDTLIRTSNGDSSARVPLTQDNVLWPVAGSLNNLLSRLQRLRQTENEVQQLRPQIQHARQLEHELVRIQFGAQNLAEVLRSTKTSKHPIRPTYTGTLLDPVIAELNDSMLFQGPDAGTNQAEREKSLAQMQESFHIPSRPLQLPETTRTPARSFQSQETSRMPSRPPQTPKSPRMSSRPLPAPEPSRISSRHITTPNSFRTPSGFLPNQNNDGSGRSS